MSNHSHSFSRRCNLLDYFGILVVIWGSGMATIYYGFFCDPHLRSFYWTTNTITALGCTILTLSPHFSKPGVRHWRAGFYAGFALSSIVFVIHGIFIHGWELQKSRMSLVWIGWMGTSLLVGTSLYVARVPEKWYPYQFDIYGSSHQLFHIAIMVDAWIHYAGLVEAFRFIRSDSHTCV